MATLILLYLFLAVIATFAFQAASIDPMSPLLTWAAAGLIAWIGVPHGGLDHWQGRRVIEPWAGRSWPLVFFPAYAVLAIFVAACWLTWPVPTIVGFLGLSAWHFGREELGQASALKAISVGGLLVWTIAIFKSEEMTRILAATMGEGNSTKASFVTNIVGRASLLLLPIGLLFSIRESQQSKSRTKKFKNALVPLATVGLAATTAILVSFTLYFCFWHSLLGLRRLKASENLSLPGFMMAVAPLSSLAVALVIGAGMVGGGISLENLQQSALMRMTFVGLAAIAVPHILLHECGPWIEEKLSTTRVPLHSEIPA